MHQTLTDGFLKAHVDFNYNENLLAYRRINLLLYLNHDWKKKYGGYLNLYDKKNLNKPISEIKPTFNTLCVFTTDDFSYHGYPKKITVPKKVSRDSISLYYYSKKPFKDFGTRGKNLNTKYISVQKDDNIEFLEIKNYIKDIFFHPKTFLIKVYKFIFKNYRS